MRLHIVQQISIVRIEAKLSASTQPAVWDRLLALPVAFFRRYTAGDLAKRAAAIDAIRSLLSTTEASTILSGPFSISLLIQMFVYSGQLALVATGVTGVALVAILLTAFFNLRLSRTLMQIEGRISGLVLEMLTGVAKIRVTGAEDRAFAEWAREFARQRRVRIRMGTVENTFTVFGNTFPVVSSILIFSVMFSQGMTRVSAGGAPISPGHFIAFITAFAMFLAIVLNVGTTILASVKIVPLYERAKPILEASLEVDRARAEPGELTGRIDVEQVSFRDRAAGPLVLDRVTLGIAPGTFVAIVGPSGSGKSTLLRLLLGLETIDSGSIAYDGRNLAVIDVQKPDASSRPARTAA